MQGMGWPWAQAFSTVCVHSSVYVVWLQVSPPTPSAWSALLCLGLLMTPKSPETQCGCHLSLQAALTPLAGAVATSTLPGVVFIGGKGVSFTSVSLRSWDRPDQDINSKDDNCHLVGTGPVAKHARGRCPHDLTESCSSIHSR